jgi:hypothetical protein
MAMRKYHWVGFTAAQSAELWERWKKGEGLKSIGRAFGKPSSCIFAHLRPSGGIMPPARRRSRLALTMAEREEIGAQVRAIHTLSSYHRDGPMSTANPTLYNGMARRHTKERGVNVVRGILHEAAGQRIPLKEIYQAITRIP